MSYQNEPRKTATKSPITAARIAAGLTQAQLAEKIGVAAQHIGRWERGERKPKTDALIRLSNALKCDMMDLLR